MKSVSLLGRTVCLGLLMSLLWNPFVGWAESAPRFWISNLSRTDSKTFNSRKQKGPYVISFFFTACEPCVEEIPLLHKMMTTEFPGVPLLFIDPLPEDTEADIRDFAQSLGVPDDFFYRDALGRIGRKFFKKEMAFPTIIGVNNRKIIFRYPGLKKEHQEGIRNALK